MRWTSLALALLQYQSIAGPLAVPDPASETQAADRWVARYPDRVERPSTHPSRRQAVVAPVFVPTAADDPQTPDRWGPRYPDLTPRRALAVALHRVLGLPEFVPAPVNEEQPPDRWWARYPDAVRRATLPEAVRAGGQAAAPLFVPDVTQPLTALSWRATFADRTRRQAPVPAQQAHAWHTATPADVTGYQSADHGGGDIPVGTVSIQYAPLVGPVSGVAAATQADVRWRPSHPDRLDAARRHPPGGPVAPVLVPDVTQPPSVLSWAPRGSDLPRAVRLRPAPDFQESAAPVEVPDWLVPNLAWHRQQTEITARQPSRVHIAQNAAWDVVTPAAGTFTDLIEVDGGPPPRPRPGQPASRQQAYASAPPELPVTPATGLTWAPRFADRAYGPQRRTHAERPQPLFGFVVAVPVMSWTGNALATGQPPRGRAQPPLPHGVTFVPDVTDPAPPRSWAPSYPDRAPGPRRAPSTGAVTPIVVPDVTDGSPALAWLSRFADAPRRAVRVAEFAPFASLGYLPDITLVAPPLASAGCYADRVDRPAAHAARQQALAWPPFVVGVTAAPPDILNAPAPLPRPAIRLVAPQHLAWDPATQGVAAVVTDLSWTPRYPDRPDRTRQTSEGGYALAENLDLAPDRSWAGWHPDLVPGPVPRPRPPGDPQPFVADVTEPAPPLAWAPSAPDQIRRLSALPPGALLDGPDVPAFVPDVTDPVPDRSWSGSHPDAIARTVLPVAARQASSGPAFVPGVTDPVVGIAWQPEFADRAPGVTIRTAEQQATAWPPFIVDVTNVVAALAWQPRHADRVDPRRWLPSAAQQALAWFPEDATVAAIVPDLRRQTFVDAVPRPTYPASAQLAVAAPWLVPDVTDPVVGVGWLSAFPDRFPTPRPVLGWSPDGAMPVLVPDVTEPIPALSWSPAFPDASAPMSGLAARHQHALAWFPESPSATASAVIEIVVEADDREIVVEADDREIDVGEEPA